MGKNRSIIKTDTKLTAPTSTDTNLRHIIIPMEAPGDQNNVPINIIEYLDLTQTIASLRPSSGLS